MNKKRRKTMSCTRILLRRPGLFLVCSLFNTQMREARGFSTSQTKVKTSNRISRHKIIGVLHKRTTVPRRDTRLGKRKPMSQQNMVPDIHCVSEAFHSAATHLPPIFSSTSAISESHNMVSAIPKLVSVPFEDMGKDLFDALNIGEAIGRNVGSISDKTIGIVLDTLGRDIILFLSASVVVTLVSNTVGITPILGYLLAGAILGPHGFDIFANTKADVELGDFGILFLLFSEGLEVSKARLNKLSQYLPLGFAQISLCTGVITAAILGGFPAFLRDLSIPIQATFIQEINPVEAVIVAIAGALSTSAFVFPVLKDQRWEDDPSGEAATSVLLLQDLMVAPLLVLLPYLVGQDTTDYTAIGFLTAKAVFGFGGTLVIGRYVIGKLFDWVSKAQSAETFVALCLLVSAGMGTIAKSLGLTDTAGAFAAGVLLANTNYRAQIQADILPFKAILLGIFFMDAGSTFDTDLAVAAWPTIVAGVVTLIALKCVTMLAATRVPKWMEPNRLPLAEGVRLAILLSGGGEFAFVVLALAERLGVVSKDLSGVLTAIVLITMGLTPLLGQAAAIISGMFEGDEEEPQEARLVNENGAPVESGPLSTSAIVVVGYNDIGHTVIHSLAESRGTLPLSRGSKSKDHKHEEATAMVYEQPSLVAFDKNPDLLKRSLLVEENTAVVMFGDGSNPSVIRSSGIEDPQAIFICFEEHNDVLAATSRLSTAFPRAEIFARAQTRKEAESLKVAGASEVVVEADELGRSAPGLMRMSYINNAPQFDDTIGLKEQLRRLAAAEAGIAVEEVDCLLNIYKGMDQNGDGYVDIEEVIAMLRKSNTGFHTDEDTLAMETWFKASGLTGKLTILEFFQLYGRVPDFIEEAFGCSNVNEKVLATWNKTDMKERETEPKSEST